MALETSAKPFEDAIVSLKETITAADALAFQGTSIEEVWKLVEGIQLAQRQRKSLHSIRTVEPFLKSLEGYSKILELTCGGDPIIFWLWVVLSG
jgi:hypothetical protein